MKKLEFDTYATTYDMMNAVLTHRCADEDPKIVDDSYSDPKLMRYEVGVKCVHCSESFRIAIRRLRTTYRDPRIKELSDKYPYMDLLKMKK
tara:strand:- start:280 stop:552 length:273 start_codon:yes stop_codon:yes gene_type:complete